jgi:hypothetical protein
MQSQHDLTGSSPTTVAGPHQGEALCVNVTQAQNVGVICLQRCSLHRQKFGGVTEQFTLPVLSISTLIYSVCSPYLRLKPAGELRVFSVAGHGVAGDAHRDALDLLRVHLGPGGWALRLPAAPLGTAASLPHA